MDDESKQLLRALEKTVFELRMDIIRLSVRFDERGRWERELLSACLSEIKEIKNKD